MADVGEHQFKYSIYPHRGPWGVATQREAYLLNDPILINRSNGAGPVSKAQQPSLPSLISTSSTNVIIETVKRAEDGNGIIVRLYESQRKRGLIQVQAGFGLQAAWVTNLLEENEKPLSVENDTIQLQLNPYQIVTLRLVPEAG